MKYSEKADGTVEEMTTEDFEKAQETKQKTAPKDTTAAREVVAPTKPVVEPTKPVTGTASD